MLDGLSAEELIASGVFQFNLDSFQYPAARWNGFQWEPLGAKSARGIGFQIAMVDLDDGGPAEPTVIMMGSLSLQGASAFAFRVVQLVNDQWVPLPGGVPVTASSMNDVLMETFDLDGAGPQASQFFVAGRIPGIIGPEQFGIGRWTGTSWEYLPGRFSQMPRCIVLHDEDGEGPHPPCIFVAHSGTTNGVQMNGLARWDGMAWTALVNVLTGTIGLGSPVNQVQSLLSFDVDGIGSTRPVLCAGGVFANIDGLPFNHIGAWDGGQWRTMGPGFGYGGVSSMIALDEDGNGPESNTLIASGLLKSSGGQMLKHFARWNGATWEPFAGSVVGTARRMVVTATNGDWGLPPNLWAFGNFSSEVVRWGPSLPYLNAFPRSQTSTTGGGVVLRVAAGGEAPFAYQWRKNGQTLVDGDGIVGSTTAEVVISPFSDQDVGQYDCIVSNACGSITSPPAGISLCSGPASADMSGDGATDGRDIAPFVSQFLLAASSVPAICTVDFNQNHVADASDATAFVALLLAN